MPQSIGSVYQRGDGKWCAALQVNGKRKVVYGKTEREAKKKLTDLQRQLAVVGSLPDCGKRTVNDLLDQWLSTVTPTLKPRTIAEYAAICDRYLRPAIGTTRLDKLTPDRVQMLYADLQARGLQRAPQAAHVALHRALKMAVLWRWLPDNPAERVIKPKYQAERKQLWTKDELQVFLAATLESRLHPLWVTAIATGCRFSELAGLRWEDVNNRTITVRATVHRIKGEWVTSTPKTRAGSREIILPPEAVVALRRQKVLQNELRLRAGACWQDRSLVFTGETGQPLSASTVEHALHRECKRLGIREISPHAMRHLHASLLLSQGLPVPAVSARLGHANPSITLQVYSHALKGQDEQAAQAIEKALSR